MEPEPERRQYVEPGIYKRYGHYLVVVKVNGRQVQQKPDDDTLRSARNLRRKLQQAQEEGKTIAPARLTVSGLLDMWLEEISVTAESQNTRSAYQLDCSYWQREMGDIRVRKLTPGDVESARDRLLKPIGTLSPKSVANAVGTLRTALTWAEKHEIVYRNVARLVEKPAVPRFESHWADKDEAERLMAELLKEGAPYGLMCALSLATGLRGQSQWGGMRWQDVDLKRKVAELVQVRYQNGMVGPARGYKNKRRQIPLSGLAVAILEEERKWQARKRDEVHGRWRDSDGYVFTNMRGDYLRTITIQRTLQRCLERAGIPKMRFHDLRHTAATLWLSAGVTPAEVAALGGWSTPVTLMRVYAHAIPSATVAAADALGSMLAGENQQQHAKEI